MKKVVAYVASRNNNSRTVTITENLLTELKRSLDHRINITLITPLTHNVFPPTGCKSCFNHGICPSESLMNDDTNLIKKELLEADLLFLVSPVYSHNVSGDMKNLIDRISYWAHIFKLASKPIILLASAESNGAKYVINYMNKVFSAMGATIIGQETFLNTVENSYKEKVDSIINLSKKILSQNAFLSPTEQQENLFQYLKETISTYNNEHFEYNYWLQNGLFKKNSLEEYFIEKQKIK
ncbi:NAD(P)H-dependent oxidoreductase [Bacillus cereus]|uniref:flavodoxin family protein n=1 Tax=Bacillus cereus group TaxID=86661 RepID=UPI0007F979B7|nr:MULTISPECIES: NAD(P)H-dependent oxidoreductase [Bacillus cereus group]ARV95869.1 hypothetical protein BJG91_25890 [Bacillus thuringiensis]MDZ4489972.1 NAD(P)H-dependent oxidoreductase [Bacillus cereus]MDZ4572435.1 NAD(P)H-dependent oxidoreductase [Bacillus cereus]MDZ4638335.1 NAD(P)H-dependent oxidoreductase [Bacillus cereus]MEB9660408.1 NAD(P)H-dependent oxidoreductase [Bacillus cereus]